MNALARREHSEKEIYLKFISLVESKNKLLEEINKLKEEGLLSDDRFAEAYIKSRYYSGFGPVRIQYELEKKGVLQNKIEIKTKRRISAKVVFEEDFLFEQVKNRHGILFWSD